MAINKVVYGGRTLIDLTSDTAIASDVASGKTFHLANGTQATGTASGGGDSTFIVTLLYNDQTEMWEPDCTFWDLQDAFYNGDQIVCETNDGYYVGVAGEYTAGQFYYAVYSNYESHWWSYIFDDNGVEPDGDYETIEPYFQTVTKTYTPTESVQTETVTFDTSYYNGLQEVDVTVNAIPSSYVGSGITRRSSSDLTASGATVTAPAGYYASSASKSVASGSATTPTTTITANPIISVNSSGLITATASASQNITPTVSAGYVSAGTAGTVTVSGSNTSQLTTQGAQTITPSTSNQTIASGRYLTGTQTISGDANLVAGNIKKGVSIFNVAGSYEGSGGGGGSAWTKVAETSYQVSTTSTSASTVATWETGHSEIWTSDKIVYVRIRDTAGKRNGYFYGTDNFFMNMVLKNNPSSSNTSNYVIRMTWSVATDGLYNGRYGYTTTGYGIYPNEFYANGDIVIYQRYNSTYSRTINGTYKVEVYLLDPAGGVPIFA